jgi:hypothetical protein
VDPERVAVAPDQVDVLVRTHPAERRTAFGQEHQPGVARQVARGLDVGPAVVVQLVEHGRRHLELGHAAVAGVGVPGALAVVLLGTQADRGGLDPHGQVLGDQGDVVVLVGEVASHREDPGVVVAEPEPGRQGVGVGVVELDADRPALLADRHRLVEPPVGGAQLVEHAQRRPGEEAELRVVSLRLELGDHDHRKDDLVLLEPAQRAGVRQQHAGVEDEGSDGALLGRGLARPLRGLRHRVPLTRPRAHPAPGPDALADGPERCPKAGVPAPCARRTPPH